MPYAYFIALLAVIQYCFFAILVGRARAEFGVKPPTVTGPEGFERVYRVHMNTLEQLVAFLPALLIASQFWSPVLTAIIGTVYLVGRLLYWRAYVADPAKRMLGFLLTVLPTWVLIVLGLIGAITAVL